MFVFIKSWSESHCCGKTREDSFSDIFLVVNPTTFIAARKLRQNNDQNNCQSNYQLAITQQVPASLSHCHRVIESEYWSDNFTTRSLGYLITAVVYWPNPPAMNVSQGNPSPSVHWINHCRWVTAESAVLMPHRAVAQAGDDCGIHNVDSVMMVREGSPGWTLNFQWFNNLN